MSPAELLAAVEPTVRHAARRGVSPDDRADVQQAIRLRVLEDAHRYDPQRGSPATFAKHRALGVLRDYHRQGQRTVFASDAGREIRRPIAPSDDRWTTHGDLVLTAEMAMDRFLSQPMPPSPADLATRAARASRWPR